MVTTTERPKTLAYYKGNHYRVTQHSRQHSRLLQTWPLHIDQIQWVTSKVTTAKWYNITSKVTTREWPNSLGYFTGDHYTGIEHNTLLQRWSLQCDMICECLHVLCLHWHVTPPSLNVSHLAHMYVHCTRLHYFTEEKGPVPISPQGCFHLK